ncbi:MAG TPA: manganese efflux pump [Atribacteraceae bacterium]|nr:manganese efflux pump [Atribacteraceae bacterium]
MLTLSVIAVGLGLDAFSLAVAFGMCHSVCNVGMKLRLALSFGFFQVFMLITGFFTGAQIAHLVETSDHWIIFAVLGTVGLKMIRDALKTEEDQAPVDYSRGLPLLAASAASSIDALAVGFSLGLITNSIVAPALLIGTVTCLMTFAGVELGNRVGRKLVSRPELIGGIAILAIGVKILLRGIIG